MSPQTLDPVHDQQDEQDPTTRARVAAARARALRARARTMTSPSALPLRTALLMRAGELDLTAAVLSEPTTTDTSSPLMAIA